MTVTYQTTMTAICPVDGTVDVYRLTITADQAILVEEILAAISEVTRIPRTQEEITELLALKLGHQAKVTTSGAHSGVRTEVTARDVF